MGRARGKITYVSSTVAASKFSMAVNSAFNGYFTSTETIRTIGDGEPRRTTALTFTLRLLSSAHYFATVDLCKVNDKR